MTGLSEGKIAFRRDWAPGLATIGVEAAIEAFAPGQFVNLALDVDGALVRRAYSLASAPGATLEFYVNEIEGGALSPSLFRSKIADRVLVDPKPQGFFTLDWVPDAAELWLIATGTGLAPFMSMLRDGRVFQRFQALVLAHSVRSANQLGYAAELEALEAAHDGRFKRVAIVSRETPPANALPGRVTTALVSGALERAAGRTLAAERSHVMLCGNPEMIDEMLALLDARGLRRHRTRRPGHVTIERFWDEKAGP